MLFADGVGFGVIDRAGKATRVQDKGKYRRASSECKRYGAFSSDARTVQVRDNSSKRVFRFDLAHRAVTVDQPRSQPRVKLTDWEDVIP